MKKTTILFAIIILLGCNEDNSKNEYFFNPKELSKLELQNTNNFWGNDSIKRILDFSEDAIFNTHPEYLGGSSYQGKKGSISVTVFTSQKASIEAMEYRRNNVASIIYEGKEKDSISEKWWYGQDFSNVIFLNKFNTIIEIAYNHYPSYPENKPVLILAANEIAEKIDELSEYK